MEGYGFRVMCKKLQPQLDVPSRCTIAKDCYKIHLKEKVRLTSLLKNNYVRVCLIIDCWTLIQNLNYMILIAHFINND